MTLSFMASPVATDPTAGQTSRRSQSVSLGQYQCQRRGRLRQQPEAEGEAGGTYLFEDEAALKAYLDGPLAAAVMAHPALSDITAQPYAVMEDCTAVTRGPV